MRLLPSLILLSSATYIPTTTHGSPELTKHLHTLRLPSLHKLIVWPKIQRGGAIELRLEWEKIGYFDLDVKDT